MLKIKPFYGNIPVTKEKDWNTFLSAAKKDYPKLSKTGIFKKNKKPAFYLYRVHSNNNHYVGFLATINVAETLLKGKVLKHELTLKDKEDKMIVSMNKRKAMLKPVMLTYKYNEEINTLIHSSISGEADFSFNYGTEKHEFWKLEEEQDIQQLQKLFGKKVDTLFIADGHHRVATTLKLYKQKAAKEPLYEQLFCAFFSDKTLDVLDFNRVIKKPDGWSSQRLLATLSSIADIKYVKKPCQPKAKHEMCLLLDKEWYILRWRKKILDKYKNKVSCLDVEILNEVVIEQLLGVKDIQSNKFVDYIEGVRGIEEFEQVVSKKRQCFGVLLHPVSIKDVQNIAKADEIMPPKSTWFEPRMRSGLVTYTFF